MLVLKGCKRCTGDLYLERGIGESNVVCLQCGGRWRVRCMPALESAPKRAA
jgi:hypothetical protein